LASPPFPAARPPLLALRVTVAALVVVFLALALRPAGHLFDEPLTEDGFYALAIARNIGTGQGITIDGQTWTNGFQPLFTFLQAGAYALAGGADAPAMRLILTLHALFYLGAAALLGLIARDAWPRPPQRDLATRQIRFWLGALLVLASPLLFGHAFNGLETGTALFLYLAAWRWHQTGRAEAYAGAAVLGALLGLLVLARIDAAFLVPVLLLVELWRFRRAPMRGLARAVLIGAVAVAVASPWFLYNLDVFGELMPSSGTAQQVWAIVPERWLTAAWAMGMMLVPWVMAGAYEGDATWILRGVLIALATIAAIIIWRHRGLEALRAQDARTKRTVLFGAVIVATACLQAAYYTLSFVNDWHYYRYFVPLTLPVIVAVAVMGAEAARIRTGRWLAAAVVLLAIPNLALGLLAWNGQGVSGVTVFYDQVALVGAQVPEGDRVAAGQSGTLGFFRPRVVNVDGKVNRAAIPYQSHMWDYLAERDIRWFCDWPDYVQRYLGPDPAARGWRLVGERGAFRLYRRD